MTLRERLSEAEAENARLAAATREQAFQIEALLEALETREKLLRSMADLDEHRRGAIANARAG